MWWDISLPWKLGRLEYHHSGIRCFSKPRLRGSHRPLCTLTTSLQIPSLIDFCSASHNAMHLSTGSQRWFLWNITSCCLLRQTVLCSGHILGPAIILRLWGHCGKAGCLWAGRITTGQVLTLSPGRHVSSTFGYGNQRTVFAFQKNPTWFFPWRQWYDS